MRARRSRQPAGGSTTRAARSRRGRTLTTGTCARASRAPQSRVAVTIAREYTSVFGNAVAANGWLQLAADALPRRRALRRARLDRARRGRAHARPSQGDRRRLSRRSRSRARSATRELEIHALVGDGHRPRSRGTDQRRDGPSSTPRSPRRPPARPMTRACSATSSATWSRPARSPRTCRASSGGSRSSTPTWSGTSTRRCCRSAWCATPRTSCRRGSGTRPRQTLVARARADQGRHPARALRPPRGAAHRRSAWRRAGSRRPTSWSRVSRTCPRWRSRGLRCSSRAASRRSPSPSCTAGSTWWDVTTCSPPRCWPRSSRPRSPMATSRRPPTPPSTSTCWPQDSERERDRADAALALGRVAGRDRRRRARRPGARARDLRSARDAAAGRPDPRRDRAHGARRRARRWRSRRPAWRCRPSMRSGRFVTPTSRRACSATWVRPVVRAPRDWSD